MDNTEMAIGMMEKVHTVYEILKMQLDITDINCILGQVPVDVGSVVHKIKEINAEHCENIIIYNMIFPPVGKTYTIDEASDSDKINDLAWKEIYLKAKSLGKTFDELVKELHKTNGANRCGRVNYNGQNEI